LILGSITVIGFFVLLPGQLTEVDANFFRIIWNFFSYLTITISPALPAAMNFGISFALSRLKDEQIFCVSPPRIIMSGRVDTICFDKTGTLTEDGMILKGVVPMIEEKLNDKLT
jgi:cation-transporting ATPase 13A3/4/5